MTIINRSKNHVNIICLLTKCEERFQQLKDKCDWRLEQYIKSLFEMIDQEKMTGKLNDELIAAEKKAKFFRGLIDAYSKPNVLEQYDAIQTLQSNNQSMETINDDKIIKTTKQIHSNEMMNCDKRIKRELFQKQQSNNENNLNGNLSIKNRNYDDIIKYHELLQEKVTNEMVVLVGNLKHNLTTSNEIVKKDTELLEKTNRFTEKNVLNLKKNTDKIREFASAACEYWLWISLVIVIVTFLSMVILIRLFPKKATIIVVNNLAGQQHTAQQYHNQFQSSISSDQMSDSPRIEL